MAPRHVLGRADDLGALGRRPAVVRVDIVHEGVHHRRVAGVCGTFSPFVISGAITVEQELPDGDARPLRRDRP